MCETVGYVPRSSVGKEVRCANRDCMVPVFVAPKPEKKKDEEEAPPKEAHSEEPADRPELP